VTIANITEQSENKKSQSRSRIMDQGTSENGNSNGISTKQD